MRVHAHLARGARSSQNGVTIVIALIALIVLLLSGVALIRSMDTSLSTAGNLAFKRDLTNQSERVMASAVTQFNAIAVAGLTVNDVSKNYFATMLPTNEYGVPRMLVDDSLWTGTAADMADSASGISQLRYVIDRLCTATGDPTQANCSYAYKPRQNNPGDGLDNGKEPAEATSYYVYRITVRAVGPRGTVAFVQSTFMR